MKNVALIGMAGNVKAAVANALAQKLGMMPFDCYEYIAFSNAATIEDIVKVAGMAYLEKLTSRTVDDASEMQNVLFFCGDVAPLSERDLAKLHESCHVVFLKASTKVILSKYSMIKPRSSLLDEERIDELNAVCHERYARFCDLAVNVGKSSLESLTKKIADWLQSRP